MQGASNIKAAIIMRNRFAGAQLRQAADWGGEANTGGFATC